jgi:hypothetical protein
MTESLWTGVIGTTVGGITAIISSWITSAVKNRSDENARFHERQLRLQERQFQLEDQERERKKALEEANAAEDRYWFDKSLKFTVIQSKIWRSRGKDELIKASQELQAFLEETPEYLIVGENISFLYRYCNSAFIEEHPSLKAGDSLGMEFAKELIGFRTPSGADIRKRRNAAT